MVMEIEVNPIVRIGLRVSECRFDDVVDND